MHLLISLGCYGTCLVAISIVAADDNSYS